MERVRLTEKILNEKRKDKVMDLSGYDICDLEIQIGNFGHASFVNARLKNVKFHGMNLRSTKWNGATLEDCEFIACDMTSALLIDCTIHSCIFSGVMFHVTDIVSASFDTVSIRQSYFGNTNIRSSLFENVEFVRCHMKGLRMQSTPVLDSIAVECIESGVEIITNPITSLDDYIRIARHKNTDNDAFFKINGKDTKKEDE